MHVSGRRMFCMAVSTVRSGGLWCSDILRCCYGIDHTAHRSRAQFGAFTQCAVKAAPQTLKFNANWCSACCHPSAKLPCHSSANEGLHLLVWWMLFTRAALCCTMLMAQLAVGGT